MSGNSLGYLKGKMGLKGKTKPGEMLTRMNEMKRDNLKQEVKTESKKVEATIKKII